MDSSVTATDATSVRSPPLLLGENGCPACIALAAPLFKALGKEIPEPKLPVAGTLGDNGCEACAVGMRMIYSFACKAQIV